MNDKFNDNRFSICYNNTCPEEMQNSLRNMSCRTFCILDEQGNPVLSMADVRCSWDKNIRKKEGGNHARIIRNR